MINAFLAANGAVFAVYMLTCLNAVFLVFVSAWVEFSPQKSVIRSKIGSKDNKLVFYKGFGVLYKIDELKTILNRKSF